MMTLNSFTPPIIQSDLAWILLLHRIGLMAMMFLLWAHTDQKDITDIKSYYAVESAVKTGKLVAQDRVRKTAF